MPLDEWGSERLVEIPRGIHRHVVRFVEYDGVLYALKELPPRLAEREYTLLRRLRQAEIPVVEVAGIVTERGGSDEGVLITRCLDFSLPYRLVLARELLPDFWNSLLDSFSELLVRLHLEGFFWGDCSLSNTLFRRDAGGLSAYLVDAETGELHDQLSDGQREHDLTIAEENVVGELYDLQEELGRVGGVDPLDFAEQVRGRYASLWAELTSEDTFGPDERFRLDERLRRLNELGFDVEEIELLQTESGYRLRLHSKVVEAGHHRRRLLHLTGLAAQEKQARRLLNDITAMRAELERLGDAPVSEAALAGRWLTEEFEPAIAAIPSGLRGKREPAELFHELLEHRWFLSEQAGADVGMPETIRSYVSSILPAIPDERATLVTDQDEAS